MHLRYLIVALVMLMTTVAKGQTGYKIDFKIHGLKDTTVYLFFYDQEKTYVKDTARVNHQGTFAFSGPEALNQGIYMLVLDKARVFEFVIGNSQRFSFETSTDDYIKKMIVKGDEDNRLFFENMVFQGARYQEVEPSLKVLRDSTLSDDAKKAARATYEQVLQKVRVFEDDILQKYPATVTARIIRMNRQITVPDAPKKPDGSIDSTFQFRYYRQHYFDNYDLGDALTLRVPKVMYEQKVKDYLNRLFIQHPDTITKAIDHLVSIAKRDKETYKYLVWKCIVNYQAPEIMGLDEVYVNLVDKYIASGEMDYWLDKKTVQNLVDYASKVRRAMIGRTASNMIMQNENLQPKSMYDLKNKYTLIWFFKPTCGHCREETPKLVQFYNANRQKYDFEVFAVSTDTSMREMKDFIRDMNTKWITVNGPRSYIKKHFSEMYFAETTPTLYIIDNKKKIIARKLGVDQLDGFFENYEKMMQRKTGP